MYARFVNYNFFSSKGLSGWCPTACYNKTLGLDENFYGNYFQIIFCAHTRKVMLCFNVLRILLLVWAHTQQNHSQPKKYQTTAILLTNDEFKQQSISHVTAKCQYFKPHISSNQQWTPTCKSSWSLHLSSMDIKWTKLNEPTPNATPGTSNNL